MIWVGSTENRSVISKRKMRDINPSPIEKSDNKPPLTIAEIVLPNASITRANTKGDKRGQRVPFP